MILIIFTPIGTICYLRLATGKSIEDYFDISNFEKVSLVLGRVPQGNTVMRNCGHRG